MGRIGDKVDSKTREIQDDLENNALYCTIVTDYEAIIGNREASQLILVKSFVLPYFEFFLN